MITALLAGGQTALHTLFGFGQHGTPTGAVSDAALVAQAARLLCGPRAISPAEAQRVLADARIAPHGPGAHPADAMAAGPASLLPSLPMMLGHVLAALAAGWLLRRGDLALLRLADLSAQGSPKAPWCGRSAGRSPWCGPCAPGSRRSRGGTDHSAHRAARTASAALRGTAPHGDPPGSPASASALALAA